MGYSLLSVGLFYLAIFAVGVYASRRGREDGTSHGLLLASRKVPIVVGVFTMTATWVGGGYLNGTAEAVYDSDQGIVWAQAPWCYALSLMLGGLFFAGRMRRMGLTTLLDPFEIRYGKKVTAGLFVAAVLGEVFWSAAILLALGATFATILDFPVQLSILISAAIAVAYTFVGGLWSVAYTDVLQLCCILLGLGLAVPFAVSAAGGAENVWSSYSAQTPGFPQGESVWLWVDTALMLTLGGIPWQVYFQRVLASRDAPTAVRLSWIAGVGCLVMAVPAVIIGAAGAVADWSTTTAPSGLPPDAAMVLPCVLKYLTPTVVAVIGLGAVAAAVMSSVDSSILSASSMFVWNVYRPLIRTGADDREIRRALRASVLVVGAAATVLALSIDSVYALWILCSELVYAILFPQLVAALFDRRANRTGAIAGAVVGLVLRLGGGFLAIPAFISYPANFPFRTSAMLGAMAAIFVVSRVTAHVDPPRPLPDGAAHRNDVS